MAKYRLSALASLVAVAAFAVSANAAKTWNGGASTDWATAANWTTPSVPAAADTVYANVASNVCTLTSAATVTSVKVGQAGVNGRLDIGNGGVLTTATSGYLDFLYAMGSTTTGTAVVNVTGNGSINLTAQGIRFGAGTTTGGTATLNMSDSASVSATYLYTGYTAGVVSNVTLSGNSTLTTSGAITLGNTAGCGESTMTVKDNATVSSGSSIKVGSVAGAVAHLNIQGGTVKVIGGGNFSICQNSGTADVTQTGGTLDLTDSISGTLFVGGFNTSGTAAYNLNAGTVKTGTGGLVVGSSATTGSGATLHIGSTGSIISKGAAAFGSTATLTADSGAKLAITANSGSLNATTGDPYYGKYVYVRNSSSSASNMAGLNNLKLVIAGGTLADSSQMGVIEVGSADMGKSVAGLTGNFALDTLQIGDGTTVGNAKLVDLVANSTGIGSEVLYVKKLVVTKGSTLDLNFIKVYYMDSVIEGTILNDVPEPATMALLAIGGGLVALRNRRKGFKF